MIHAHPMVGGYGNYMFQYAFNRMLAERLNYRLVMSPCTFELILPIFPGLVRHTPVPGMVVDGRVVPAENGPEFLLGEASYEWPGITLDEIADDQAHKNFQICSIGYWERAYWYVPERERLRQWFVYNPMPEVKCPVLSVRGGDRRDKTTEELPYYRRVLKQLGGHAIIVTDDPDWDAVKAFKLPVYHCGGAEDFRYTAAASDTLVIGRSTFSWWAAFLGHAKRVIQPLPEHGFRSREQFWNDLTVPEWEQQPL